MEFLHQEMSLDPSDVVEVSLDHPANVLLLDEANYDHYRNHRGYRYLGGHIKRSPYRISAPRAGRWHLVVDLGGGPGVVRASATVVPGTAKV
jgi:hypothetical protein